MEAANFLFLHPRGPIYGYIGAHGVRELRLPSGDGSDARIYLLHGAPNIGLGRRLHAALEQYFQGIPQDFGDIPLDYGPATPFRRSVWDTARTVAWGVTSSYGDLARRMGKGLSSARAIGAALGANPLPILVPCHRFIAADGSLAGFAAGLDWKRELLRLEGALWC